MEVKLHALTSSLHGSGQEKENHSTQWTRHWTEPKAALNVATKERLRTPVIKPVISNYWTSYFT
jgi:hypothetical protein